MDFVRLVELIFAGGVGGILLALAQYVRARGQNRNEAQALGNTADAQQRDYLLKLQELTNADERQLRETIAAMWAETRQQLRDTQEQLRQEQQKRVELDARLTETQKQLTVITLHRDELQKKYDQAQARSDDLKQKYEQALARIRQLEKEVAELKEHSQG